MSKMSNYTMTAVFGIPALVLLVLHLGHCWAMHNAISQWETALTERVLANARMATDGETDYNTVKSDLSWCRIMLTHKKGDTDPAFEARIAEQVAELEAEDRAQADARAYVAANTRPLPISRAVHVVMRFLDNVAHYPQSTKVQEWGDLTLDPSNGTYLLPVRWSWKSKMGVEVFERKIFRITSEGNILQLINF